MRYIEEGVRSLLLAVDFSQTSKRAFDAAIRMARTFRATLHLLHVNEEEHSLGGHDSSELARFVGDIARRRAEWMTGFERRARDLGIAANATMRDGDPAETILRTAEELGVGMLVLGMHGAREARILPGSVARKVLRHAERPVLVVSHMAGVAPAESGGTFESIVYPTDLSEGSRAGIRVARIIAQRTDARLTLAHVVRIPRIIPALPGEVSIMFPPDVGTGLELERRAELEELVDAVGDDRVECDLLVDEDPAQGICSLASESGHDLIVLPRHSVHRLGCLLFGHTAEHVARMAPVPVLLFSPRPV